MELSEQIRREYGFSKLPAAESAGLWDFEPIFVDPQALDF